MKKVKLSAFAALVGALIAVLAIAPPASAAPAANAFRRTTWEPASESQHRLRTERAV